MDFQAVALFVGNGVGFALLYFMLRGRLEAVEKRIKILDNRMWEHIQNPGRKPGNDSG